MVYISSQQGFMQDKIIASHVTPVLLDIDMLTWNGLQTHMSLLAIFTHFHGIN